MPAAALAFAAAAAAPGSAAAPPSGLSHGVSRGTGCCVRAPLGRRGPAICMGAAAGRRRLGAGGEAVLRARRRVNPVCLLPRRRRLSWEGAASAPGKAPGGLASPTPTPSSTPSPPGAGRNVAAAKMAAGWAAAGGVSHRAGGGAAARPCLAWRKRRLPLAAAWGTAQLTGQLEPPDREPGRGTRWLWRHVFPVPYSQAGVGHPASAVRR